MLTPQIVDNELRWIHLDAHTVVQENRYSALLLSPDRKIAFSILKGKRRDDKLRALGIDPNIGTPPPVEEAVHTEPPVDISTDIPEATPVEESEPEAVSVTIEPEGEQEFLDAAEPFTFTDTDWFSATIRRANPRTRSLILELSDGSTVYAGSRSLTKAPGSHWLCLPKGSPCVVRIAPNPGHTVAQGTYQALELQFESDEPLEDYEVCKVTSLRNHSYGSVQRLCSGKCDLFVVVPLANQHMDINVGDLVRVALSLSDRPERGYVGKILEKLAPPGDGENQ